MGHYVLAKANLRLKRPASHARVLSRVAMWDILWAGISPFIAFLIRDTTLKQVDSTALYCGVALIVSLIVFQWFQTSTPIFRFYSIRDALELLKACVLIAALTAVAIFLMTRLQEAPRSIPILHFTVLISGLLGVRVLLRLRETHRESRKPRRVEHVAHVLVLQASRLAWFFSKMVEEIAPGSCQIVAVLDEDKKLRHRSLNGYPIVGSPLDIEKIISDYGQHGVVIDSIVVAAEPSDLSPGAWREVARVSQSRKIALEVLPERLLSHHVFKEKAAPAGLASSSAIPDSILLLQRPFWTVKRGLDFAIALTAGLLLFPIALIVSVIVLVDVGVPVVFWQRRIGRNGAPLYIYKFRTLQTLYDRKTKERREATEPSLAGRILRKMRLDELPQLWNILSGDMSLIGPRPLLPIDQPNDLSLRLAIRPGLTGWAQICGGILVTPDEKSALDEWYIRHASGWLDFYILVRTIGMIFGGDRRDEDAVSVALREKSQYASLQCSDSSGMTVPSDPVVFARPASVVGDLTHAFNGSRAKGHV